MQSRTPVTFVNRNGRQLHGIFHQPDQPAAPDLAVLLLSPGVKMRVGPQRLYLRLTERLVALGLPVLRFDFEGLGDAEGAFGEVLLKDFYNHIEVGRFVNDTVDTMDWMQAHYGFQRFIVSGLCGGAITGLLAGSRDSRIAGLFGLGITPVLASRAADEAKYMTTGMLEQRRRHYLGRLKSPYAWLRVLTLQADNRAIWKAITLPLRKRLQGPTPPAPKPDQDNANPLFAPAFFRMLETGRPMQFVFGGSDRLRWEFDEKFVARHQERLQRNPHGFAVHVVPDANHVLSLTEWQDEMIGVADRWVRDHFPATAAPSPAGAALPNPSRDLARLGDR